jgi:2-dehydro-3-deoxyphosphogluconate aldolase/(4S)-4-hydroxy-2-oxoglutarate aldolase
LVRPDPGIRPRSPIAIIRLEDLSDALHIAAALVEGGITALEFTLTNRKSVEAIREVRAALQGRAQVGAGTVLRAEDAFECIEAGAQFLVTPAFLPDVVQAGIEAEVPVVCGAYTPTEILAAWRAGAALVKVFPAGRLGPGYIKDVLAPLPDLKLVPTGGINLDNCAAFLDAGAYTVAIGSSLVNENVVGKRDWRGLTEIARQYVEACMAVKRYT